MRLIKRSLWVVLVMLLAAVPTFAQDSGASVRFVQVIPGASAIDVYVDGNLAIRNLGFGSATNYISVPAAAHHLTVTASGSTDPLWEQDITPVAASAMTLVASTATAPTFQAYKDDLTPLTLDKARFTAVNAVAGGDSVDVILGDGRLMISGLQYNQPYGTFNLPVLSYQLAVVPTGKALADAIVPVQPYNLASSTSYVMVIYGTSDAPKTLLLSAPTTPDAAGGYVRIAHAIPGAPSVDVYLNNTLAVPSLAFGQSSDYLALPAGSYSISARPAGGTADIASANFALTAGAYETTAILGTTESPSIQTFTDSTADLTPNTAVLNVVNAASGSVTAAVSSADGSPVITAVSAGNAQSATLNPSDQAISVSVTASGSTSPTALDLPGGVYGGVYYDAFVVGDDSSASVVQLPAASLAQSSDSTNAAMAAAPTAAAPTEIVAVPTQPADTSANSQPGVVIQAQPTAYPTTAGPTGRVLVNPDAHLQLRLYPSKEAFSLGLAPADAMLNVNGRAGAPVPPADATATPLPPNATPFVDPVTLLADNEDLDPLTTWVNITYNTPDGGAITAWVSAAYLNIRDAQGRLMKLRDLPTIPSNRAGQSVDTSIQPPVATPIVTTAIATNVNADAHVQIRRTPNKDGESLALVTGGTQMELLGVTQAEDWAFVRYVGDQNIVRGWVSVNYLTFQRLGQTVDFARLQELLELNILTGSERGDVTATGAPTATAADQLRDVVAGEVVGVNSGVNLHLRRYNNDQAESLALMPGGTKMQVNGRSIDDVWLQVTYQGQDGWVAAQYVSLTFNGQPYKLDSLPVIDTSTPTPTPTAG